MRLNDTVLNYILVIDIILILCIVIGTFLLTLDEGLHLNRKQARAAEVRNRKKWDEYGKQYSRDELLRRRANNPQ
jgi:hypothetical protein